MTNLTQTQIETKQDYLEKQQEQMLALYAKADTNERNAVIHHIDSFLGACEEDEKNFWLRFRRKLESISERDFLFPLGNIYLTIGAREALNESNQPPFEFLARHQRGDWGELSQTDIDENVRSLKVGYRLLSAYETNSGGKIWIITEADRSFTTILLPDEY